MLLLCASLQRQVFEDENKAAMRIMAGDNVEICRDLDAASFSVHNPVPDFLHCRFLQNDGFGQKHRPKREVLQLFWCHCLAVISTEGN